MIIKAIPEEPTTAMSFKSLVHNITDNVWISNHIILGRIGNTWYSLKYIPKKILASEYRYIWMNLGNMNIFFSEPKSLTQLENSFRIFDNIFILDNIIEMIEIIKLHHSEVA